MKKVLILGASMLQLPAIKIAKTLGYYVGVADLNPKAPGVKYADEFFNVSTIDTNGIINVAKKFQADGIMTLATDMPIRSVAIACQELNLSGISPSAAIRATDKNEMMESFKSYSVPHPWFYKVTLEEKLKTIQYKIKYPCIIKPTDNSGSRGVVLVNNESELLDAYIYSKKESRSGSIIIQEYLQGCEVSVEIMVQNGIPYVIAVTDKITTGAPHFVELGHSQPSRLNEKDILKIKETAIKAVNSIGINSGPAHVEIMLTKSGPKLIELGARLGGDYITSHLVPLSTGVNMVEAVIKGSCGDEYDITQKFSKASMIKYFTATNCTIKGIYGVEDAKRIPGVVEVSFMKKEGDYVGNIYSSNDRIGFVIVQENDVHMAENVCDDAIKCIKIVTE
jgi:biotin carboxylase